MHGQQNIKYNLFALLLLPSRVRDAHLMAEETYLEYDSQKHADSIETLVCSESVLSIYTSLVSIIVMSIYL